MTITRVGSSKKYAEGWERAFGKKKSATKDKKPASGASEPAAKKKKAAKK